MTTDASPCINVCVIDPVTRYCIGCGRTTDEIAAWMGMSGAERIAVNQTLPERMQRMTSRAARKGGRHARTTTR